MNEVTDRIIDTGLTGNKAFEVLDSVQGQLSDGMWENTIWMESFWKFSSVKLENDKVLLKISNEIRKSQPKYGFDVKVGKNYIKGYKHTENKFKNMSDRQILDWYANKVKTVVNQDIKDNGIRNVTKWDKNSDFQLNYMGYLGSVTIADAYQVYEKLKNRI